MQHENVTAVATTQTLEPKPTPQSKIVSQIALVAERYDEALRRAEARASGQPLGPEVAALSPRLHEAIGEALPIGMTTFDGGPGSGKTAAAIQTAITARTPAVIVECEVRPVRILDRMIAYHTGTYLGRLLDGSLSPEEIRDLAQRTLDDLPLVEILDATTSVVTIDEITREAKALRERHGSAHVLVVLDSMHAWSGRALATEKEYDRLTQAITLVDGAAKRENISVLAILERSLATMRTPSATSGKGHAGLGYSCEIAINLDVVGQTNLVTGLKRVDMTVSKNRHGEQGFVIPLTFEGRLQRFAEVVDDSDAEVEVEADTQITGPVQRPEHQIYDEGDDALDPTTGEPFPRRRGYEDADLFGAA